MNTMWSTYIQGIATLYESRKLRFSDILYAMINANRRSALENIDNLLKVAPEIITQDEADRLKALTNAKYDRRIKLYDAGIKQWDTNMSLTMMVKGIKR